MERRDWTPNPIAKRLQLHHWMGFILREYPDPYSTDEFRRCHKETVRINHEIAERGLDTTALLKAMYASTQEIRGREQVQVSAARASSADLLLSDSDRPPDLLLAA